MRKQGYTTKVTTFKAKVLNLKKDMDYMNSTNFTFLLEGADDVDVATTYEIPLGTTRVYIRME